MDLSKKVGRRDKFARTLLAAGLAAVAIRSLRKGKRLTGILAGAGALAFGYNATSGGVELEEIRETVETAATRGETTSESGELRCAICGQPIRPGERRGPNEEGEVVHDACKAPAE